MSKQLEFFFDVQCPFAYLASTQVRALAAQTGAELIYKPVLLGGIYQSLEGGGPYARPVPAQKTRLTALDAHRWAQYFGVPLTFPVGHPVRSVLAMRAILASGEIARAAHALFEAAWARGESISDRSVIAGALSRAGFADVEGILTRTEDPEIKEDLRTRTDEAVKRGAFGVPTFFIDGEMYWGQDRLDFVARALGQDRYVSQAPPMTAAPVQDVQAWFDYSSPFAYLGMTQIAAVASKVGARVVYRPFLLGGLFREIGTPDVPMMAFPDAKRRYFARELERWAHHWGVPFRFTTRFPMRTITPLRATYAFLREAEEVAPRFIQAVYRALWSEDRDISNPDVLRAICDEQGLDRTVIDRADNPENKQELLDAGKRAAELGLCGAPTFVARGKLFWGQDRIPLLEAVMTGFEPQN